MTALWSKRKLAAVSREMPELTRNTKSQNTSVPGILEEYITPISEEIEGRITKKLSQDFIMTESDILGALSKLDKFLLNTQVRTLSGALSGTSGNNDWKTGNQLEIVPRVVPLPKWRSLPLD